MPSQWPTASSGRRGEGPAPAQRRARRLVPARKRRRWPLVAMAPARTCHASTTAEATAAPARSSCVPAPNPAAPMGRVAGRRCPHVCAVRRSPPLLQHSALVHAVWRVDGTEVSGTLAPGDGAPLHAARRRPTATTSLATPAARALLLHRMQQHQWRPTLPTAPAAKAATSAGTRAGPSGALGACSDRSGPGPACARHVPTAAGPTAARAR